MDGAFDDEAEPAVTIGEYLEEVEERELEADLVLGGDDGKECTYSKGYMKRQAVFSCLSCTPDGNAGVCTACSLSCHDGHQIVELWTKRNFRCDCGNSKFGDVHCNIFPNKDLENVENSYNHNFKGSYCTCGRPYPDPDLVRQEEMIQCCICEDWFHEEHLGLESTAEIPKDDEGEPIYEEFICKACSEVCFFIKLYPEEKWAAGKQADATVQVNKDKGVLEEMPTICESEKPMGDSSYNSPKIDDSQATVDSESISDGMRLPEGENCNSSMMSNQCTKSTNGQVNKDKGVLEGMPTTCESEKPMGDTSYNTPKVDYAQATVDSESISDGTRLSEGENCNSSMTLNQCTKSTDLQVHCLLGVNLSAATPVIHGKPLFLSKHWRDALCRCNNCLEFYNQKKIAFLLDKEDSIAEYEKVAKQKREEKLQLQEGAERNFFNKLGHVEKVEILKGIEDMKDGLRAFLESADSSKPITAADVHQFFDDIKNKRRRVQ